MGELQISRVVVVVVPTLLPLHAAILASMLVAAPAVPAAALRDYTKCKCFMCVCDFDPHPLPPELPPRHDPPPAEPEHHPPPPPPEHVPAPPEPEHYYPPPTEHEPVPLVPGYQYYPPPAYGYYPSVGLPYYPPTGEMYPRDKGPYKSGASRRSVQAQMLLAAVVVVLSTWALVMRPV